jgi:hypothetical protein
MEVNEHVAKNKQIKILIITAVPSPNNRANNKIQSVMKPRVQTRGGLQGSLSKIPAQFEDVKRFCEERKFVLIPSVVSADFALISGSGEGFPIFK